MTKHRLWKIEVGSLNATSGMNRIHAGRVAAQMKHDLKNDTHTSHLHASFLPSHTCLAPVEECGEG